MAPRSWEEVLEWLRAIPVGGKNALCRKEVLRVTDELWEINGCSARMGLEGAAQTVKNWCAEIEEMTGACPVEPPENS